MRNKSLDVYKFLFCCIIMFFHFYKPTGEHLIGGAGGVEFFVLVASMFFYAKFYRNQSSGQPIRDNLAYGKKRLLRFLPYTTIAFVLAYIAYRIIPYWMAGKEITLLQMHKWMSKDIWELLLVSMCGLNKGAAFLNGAAWTLSAMLICEVVIWGLLQYNEKLFRTLIAPCSILGILGYWVNMKDGDYKLYVGFTTFGVLRVFLIMCMGYYVYHFAVQLSRKQFRKQGRLALTAAEFLCLGISLLNMSNFSTRYFRYENILLFCVVVAIAYSGQSYSGKLCGPTALAKHLGELSLGIYLVHYSVLKIFKLLYEDPYDMYLHKFAYLIAVLLASEAFLFGVKGLMKLIKKAKNGIAKRNLSENENYEKA